MNKFAVTDIRWANTGDLSLPFWKIWNEKNPLPGSFWQRIWEYPYVASRIPKHGSILDIGGTYPFVLFPNFPEAVSVDIRNLNELDHPLHFGLWPENKLIVTDAAKVPQPDNAYDYVFSISAIEEMPHTIEVFKEMIRLARYRVLITMDISEKLGFPHHRLRELETLLGVTIPPIPVDALYSTSPVLSEFNQSCNAEYKDIRVLAITIDSRDKPKSISILIPHWESWLFLKPCLELIQKYRNPDLEEHVYVLDDQSQDGSYENAIKQFGKDPLFEFHRVERPNKKDADVGYLLDYGTQLAREQFIAMLDADVFPLNSEWLSFPIWLLEKYNCSSVGLDTGLSSSYRKKLPIIPWALPEEGYIASAGLYDNQCFTITNNLFRIIPASLAKVVSESIGFSRGIHPSNLSIFPDSKVNILERGLRRIYRMGNGLFGGSDKAAEESISNPYLPIGCDNGVAANHFIDINHMGPKYNLPLTSYIGLTPQDGAFGQNVCDLIFHFALSTRALSRERREVMEAGGLYHEWVNRLSGIENIEDTILNDMIEASTHFQPGGYDGSIPASWYEDEFNYIQKLKMEFRGNTNK